MKTELKNYLKRISIMIINCLIIILLNLLNYNISLTICKQMNINKYIMLSVKSFGIVFDITILLLTIELIILMYLIKNIKNRKNKVIWIKN